jgi:hypothetical protein
MGALSLVLMVLTGAVCLAVASEPPSPRADTSTKAVRLQQDFKTIGRLLVAYRMDYGRFPENLSQLTADLPMDVHSRRGEYYQYEGQRRRFVLSSCGEDGVYGNDDDVLFVGELGNERTGLRREVGALTAGVDEEQREQTGPTGRRPKGSCRLAGHVLDARTGLPIDHAVLYLFYKDTLDALFMEVAASGSFEFKNIPGGTYRLAVNRAAGYQLQEYRPDGISEFTLADKEQRLGIALRLEPGYRVSGRVLDEEGRPLAGGGALSVIAQRASGGEPGRDRIQAPVRPDGTYVLDGLSGEPVYVFFQDLRSEDKADAYPVRYWPGAFSRAEAVPVTFEAATSRQGIDIPLVRAGGVMIEGRVTDVVTGAPIRDALIVVHREDMLFDRVTTYTDAEGRYHLQGLGTGIFLVHTDATPQNYVRTKRRLTLGESVSAIQTDFLLNKGVTISGRIVDQEGNELPIVAHNTYGSAHVKGWSPPTEGNPPAVRSYSGVRNRFGPTGVGNGNVVYFLGEGDDGVGSMIFPTRSTFVVMGMMPGDTSISFRPSLPGKDVLRVTVGERDVTKGGLLTRAGQRVEDVLITVGVPPQEK